MPIGILDVLCSDIVVGQSDFVANGAVADVAVNNVGANGLQFFSGAGATKFELGDNILIRKIWAVIPWGFGQGGPAAAPFSHNISLSFWDGASLFVIPILGSAMNLPTLCDPMDFGEGLYAPMITTGAKRELRLSNIRLRVSQINVPAIIDGTRIPVQYFVEVNHTKPMTI